MPLSSRRHPFLFGTKSLILKL